MSSNISKRLWAGARHAVVTNSVAALLLSFGALPARGQQCITYTNNVDFDQGILQGVDHDTPDQLQLGPPSTFLFAWIANSGEGTVSKVNTQTGREVARYHTGPNPGIDSPSRTAVDRDGNCWVANRAFFGQASITQILVDGGVDRNGNGTIETSVDTDNNGVIDPGEILPWGDDERVARHYVVGRFDGWARALTLDQAGFVWVGLYNHRRVIKLDPNLSTVTYAPLAGGVPPELVAIEETAPTYGLALGPNGRLYLATLSSTVQELDPGAASGGTDPPRVLQTQNAAGTTYGIAVDRAGIVWYGNLSDTSLIRWDPTLGGAGFSYGLGAASTSRGVTVDFDGNIWLACDQASQVAKFAPTNPPTLIFNKPAGCTYPIGVGTTADGNIIAVGYFSNNWGKIDKNTGALIATGGPQTVGLAPYTYSDFTGSLLVGGLQGFWTIVQDGGNPGTEWGKVSWHSLEPQDTSVSVQARAAENTADLDTQTYVDVANGVDFSLIGRYVQVRARLSRLRSDLESPILYDLTICPANQPPDCSRAYPSISEVWPPNHQMVDIEILGVTDPDGDPVTITVTGITQDEPVDAIGDGHTAPDGAGVGTSTASVRAERMGGNRGPGNGRVYQISFVASDGQGSECDTTVTVCVPHDQGAATDTWSPDVREGRIRGPRRAPCVDDGQIYDSTVDTAKRFAAPLPAGSNHGAGRFALRAFPNPFNPSTTLEYALPSPSHVVVEIYDALGHRVRVLWNGEQPQGIHQILWNGQNDSGRGMPSGVYLYRVKIDQQEETGRLLLMK